MVTMKDDLHEIIARILKDVGVELKDEFDRNFERQGFFSDKWARRKSPLRGDGTLLIASGDLRRSIGFKTTDTNVTLYSHLPYAAIHNEGGEITVTRKMKAYFRYRFYKACKGDGFKRKKNSVASSRRLTDGGFYAWTEKLRTAGKIEMDDTAEFWRAMSMLKTGSTIKIPKRQFIGPSNEVEECVRDVIEEDLKKYFDNEFKLKSK